jgi:ATP-dependent Clp protease adapter protein ClpS
MNIYLQDKPIEETIIEDSTGTTDAAKVILYNDEVHTFDEVIIQLIKAIACSPEEAESIAWEVHSKGKAMVYEGEMPDCLRVSGILEEIALHTQIEF